MLNLDYLKRLGRNGGRLGWRVLMFLLPIVGAVLWGLAKRMFNELGNYQEPKTEERYGYLADGTPWSENVEDEQWEAYYGNDVNRI